MDAFFLSHPPVRWTAVVVMGAAALLALTRVLRGRDLAAAAAGLYVADRETDAGHAAMLAGMATMTAALSVAMGVWQALFLLISAGYAALAAVRIRAARAAAPPPLAAEQDAGAGYHVVAGLAMVYATLGEHGAHAGDAHATGQSLPLPGLGWALAGLFLFDALFTVAATLRRRLAEGWVRVAIVPHVVMDLGMSLMLVAAL